MSGKPTVNFHHSFDANIWKLLPVEGREWLALELRDADKHEATFAIYDLGNDRFLMEEMGFEEPWWVGITAAFDNTLLFHMYEDTSNPDDKVYFALDILTQEVTWQLEGCLVSHIDREVALAEREVEGEKEYFKIVLESGGTVPLTFQDYYKQVQKNAQRSENKNILHPFHYTEGHAYFETVKVFLSRKINVGPEKAVDYLEYKMAGSEKAKAIVISYYIYDQEALENHLLITDASGETLFHQIIENQLSNVGMATFFIYNDKLVATKNKKELLIFHL